MHQPFRMHSAQCVATDGELPSVIAQQHGVMQEAVRMDAAPFGPFGSDLRGVLDDRHTGPFGRGDAKLVEMRLPRSLIGEMRHAGLGQTSDQRASQSAVAQIGECHLVQHVVGMSGAQQIQEVQPGLG
jgi:hypothetical protein